MGELDDVIDRFWDLTVGVEVQAPLTDEMVAGAEDALDVRLPAAYLELLRVQNGGYTAEPFSAFPSPVPTSWAPDHLPFPSLSGIGDQGEGGILDTPRLLEIWGMPERLLLLSGDGHWWIALDYRRLDETAEPSVAWIDNELGEDIEIAHDFASFVRGLRSPTTFDSLQDLEPPAIEAWVNLEFHAEQMRAGNAVALEPRRQSDGSLFVPVGFDESGRQQHWKAVMPGEPLYAKWLAIVERAEIQADGSDV
jgi:hypothetical protein